MLFTILLARSEAASVNAWLSLFCNDPAVKYVVSPVIFSSSNKTLYFKGQKKRNFG
ncbi:MAG: hypothetical protein KKB52_03120 [Candidatus Omnitrophica bacterium]|nr:hypothetical protein [Candidatus Omnitrophota bacterium]